MTKIVMKSGETISIDEKFVKKYMESAIFEYVENHHLKCICKLNESNSECDCDCDGGYTDEHFEIDKVEI